VRFLAENFHDNVVEINERSAFMSGLKRFIFEVSQHPRHAEIYTFVSEKTAFISKDLSLST